MFSLKIEALDADPFVIMTLHGSIAGVTVYELKHEGNRLIDYLGRHIVVLDMAAVDMIDSAGIGVIALFQDLQKHGGTPGDCPAHF
jgi:anti-anti-sigma factor